MKLASLTTRQELPMFAINHAATALLVKRRFSVRADGAAARVRPGDGARLGRTQLPRYRTHHHRTRRTKRRRHPPRLHALLALGRHRGRRRRGRLAHHPNGGSAARRWAAPSGSGSRLTWCSISRLTPTTSRSGPGRAGPMLGLGLYNAAPLAAFAVEVIYGLLLLACLSGRPGPARGRRHRKPREPLLPLACDTRSGTCPGRTPVSPRDRHPRPDRRHSRPGRGSGAPGARSTCRRAS